MTVEEIRGILKDKTIGIAGAGGLGSNCAISLARSGVGKLILVDFEDIDFRNIDRQYFYVKQLGKKKVLALKEILREISPGTEVIPLAVKIQPHHVPALFKNCDILIEAFDTQESKSMFVQEASKELPHIPLISATGVSGWGQNQQLVTLREGNTYRVGDLNVNADPDMPACAPRVAIVANMQANLALELLLGKME
ncbi:MAG: sulfur carrier protein ThiS adenylyltransferase ThiF [Bacteroidales bacterium]|nr:sulfur carrier protein ThiS adenylyltransferase ThiF [Bacteroidales bacterium]